MEKECGLRKIEHEVLIAFLENIQVDNALDTYLVHHRYSTLIDPNHRRWRQRMWERSGFISGHVEAKLLIEDNNE